MTPRRPLSTKRKAELFLAANGRCGECRQKITGAVEFDHHLALVFGGTNETENWRPLHPECHRIKSAIEHKANCKSKRLHRSWFGDKKPARKKMQSRPFDKRWRKRMDGTVVPQHGG